MHLESSGMPIVRRILHARAAPATRARGAVILGGMFVLSALFWPLQASAAAPETPPACLISPAYDPGVGELYVCPPTEAEQHLITYARRSYTEAGPLEDIWANFRGVFGNLVWINVGTREANDTSLPAWNLVASLLDRFRVIKAGDTEALQVFLAPIAAAQTSTEADRLLQQRLLTVLSDTAREPVRAPLRVVLYHVHLPRPSAARARIQRAYTLPGTVAYSASTSRERASASSKSSCSRADCARARSRANSNS